MILQVFSVNIFQDRNLQYWVMDWQIHLSSMKANMMLV